MKRKRSKETRLLHGIAQPAPSVPAWDTHGDSAGRSPFPSGCTAGAEHRALPAEPPLTPAQMQVQS